MKEKNILKKIRKGKSPRKARNDSTAGYKEYGVIRLPADLKRKFDILKVAYEIMWANGSGDLASLSIEDIQKWEPERITYEDFLLRLYDGALRIDPGLQDVLALAAEAYETAAREFNGRDALANAVRVLALRQKMAGSSPATATEDTDIESETTNDVVSGSYYDDDDDYMVEVAHSQAKFQEEWENKRKALRSSKKYYFVKGDERLEAKISSGNGKSSSFATKLNGRSFGFDDMKRQGYDLIDQDGNTIDRDTAIQIKTEHDEFYKRHRLPLY